MKASTPLLLWLNRSMVLMAIYAWVGTPMLISRAVVSFEVAWGIGLISGLLLIAVLYAKRGAIPGEATENFLSWFAKFSPIQIILFGLTLRVAWILVFPALPSSDGAVYLELAHRLLSDGRFEVAGTRAYWPPGYPFFLTPWLSVLPDTAATALSQLALYIVGGIGCFKLAQRLSGREAGCLALLIFSLWPNLVTLVGTPQKETLIIALLPWVAYFLISTSVKTILLAGSGFGFSVLVQPSLQLLLPIAILVIILTRLPGCYIRVMFFVIAAAAVVLPWSMRNADVLGKFILVSTNGGSNLYRANNPLATGGYTPHGFVDTSNFGEVKEDEIAKKLAVTWIMENPSAFLTLALEKQARFMGDDAVGVYASLKIGKGSDSTNAYAAIKLLANFWWIGIWLIIAVCSLSKKSVGSHDFLAIGWLYMFALHSIFEADGKYHVPMLWILCVWIGCAAIKNKPEFK